VISREAGLTFIMKVMKTKKIMIIPGPDLAWQDAVMQGE